MMGVWGLGLTQKYSCAVIRTLALVALLAHCGGSTPEGAGSDSSQDAAGGEAERPEWGYNRKPTRTEDGQTVFSTIKLAETMMEKCDDWVETDTRRVVISTEFLPHVLMVEVEGSDPGRAWSLDKVYPLQRNEIQLFGDWRKSAIVKTEVGQFEGHGFHGAHRPHERECFSKMVGLPTRVLVNEATWAEPARYAMVVEDASFTSEQGAVHTKGNTAIHGTTFWGTVKMSETFWSSMRRNWDSWLGVVGGLIAILTFLYGCVRWILSLGPGLAGRSGASASVSTVSRR